MGCSKGLEELDTRLASSITIPARERVQTYRSGRSEYVGGALGAAVVPAVPGERGPLRVSVLAYSLGNLWRRLVLPKRIESWSWTSMQSPRQDERALAENRAVAGGESSDPAPAGDVQRIWARGLSS